MSMYSQLNKEKIMVFRLDRGRLMVYTLMATITVQASCQRGWLINVTVNDKDWIGSNHKTSVSKYLTESVVQRQRVGHLALNRVATNTHNYHVGTFLIG